MSDNILEILSYCVLAVLTIYITYFSCQLDKHIKGEDKKLGNK